MTYFCIFDLNGGCGEQYNEKCMCKWRRQNDNKRQDNHYFGTILK